MNIAYKRVSTVTQDLRRQEEAFKGINIDKEFCDKVSGGNIDRPALNKLRLEVKPGDIIFVESISRLARNVDDLRRLVEELTLKGVKINFLKEGLTTSEGGSMGRFLLTVLTAVAEMERSLNMERVREGIRKAQKYGTRSGRPIGRPGRSLPPSFEKYYVKWKNKEITATEFSKLLEVSRTTLYRLIKEYEASAISCFKSINEVKNQS